MEKYIQIGGSIAAVIGSIYAGGQVLHDHAESTIEDVQVTSEQMSSMNQAEFKLYTTKQELRYQLLKPIVDRTDYEQMQVQFLVEEQTHWANRVRQLESKTKSE